MQEHPFSSASSAWRRLVPASPAALLAAVLAFGSAAPAHSAYIVVTPLVDLAPVGDTLDFNIVVGGLEPFFRPDEIVGAFDLDFFFDPGVLSFSGLTFGSSFGGSDEVFSGFDASAGLIDLFLFSLLFDDELAAAQGGSVVLATLSFTGISAGFSLVGVAGPDSDPFFSLIGRDFAELPIAFNTPALAGVYAVPEPGPLALFGLGLVILGLVGWGRRRKDTAAGPRHDG